MNNHETFVCGNENITDLSSPLAALVSFYRGFNQRELERVRDNWLQSDEASMANPLGGVKRGWKEIDAVYQRIFHGPGRVYVEFYDYSLHQWEDGFIVVGRERGSLDIGTQHIELAIRTSRIFTRHNNEWKQLHHHGSMDNPQLLHHYQSTLLA